MHTVVTILLIGGLGLIVAIIAMSPNKNNQTTNNSNNFNSSSSSQTKNMNLTYQFNPEFNSKAAKIVTSEGDINLILYPEYAPQTVSNFIRLAREEKFYDGLSFHRYEPGFVIQGGDPMGNGTGGPGYTVPAEIVPELRHVKGALATARTSDAINPEKASSGSQFYITLEETPFLDGEYTVFGKVADEASMAVVEKLRANSAIFTIEIID